MTRIVAYSLVVAAASYLMCTNWPFWGVLLFCSSTWLMSPTLKCNTRWNRQHVNNLIRTVVLAVVLLAVLFLAVYAGLNKDVAWKSLVIALGMHAIASAWWSYFRSPDIEPNHPA
jgi:Kef-type K+ transport system membrane component KefB